MNNNAMELNLNEMELINGGWDWKQGIFGAVTGGVAGAIIGGYAGGIPGAVIGGVVGAGLGALTGLD